MSHFVGMVLNLENGKLPQPNHGHVILANPSPILFYPVSSTEVRCLVDIPGSKLPSISNGDMAKYLKAKVAPQVINCHIVLHIYYIKEREIRLRGTSVGLRLFISHHVFLKFFNFKPIYLIQYIQYYSSLNLFIHIYL